MRRVKIFSGSSHPSLTDAICERLGTAAGECQLRKFSNGETSVNIECSIRDQDVFIVQSGSSRVNDSIMELLILIAACKGGSANKITAVMPYFPYSKQSKKKSHRGAITARMLANLLTVAGVDHVITVDLHASQMQGFFTKPVDNLHAEPLIARWIRHNIVNWRESVVVSKNPGGTKRVTQLADVLKLNFAMITTDRRRVPVSEAGWASSRFQSHFHSPAGSENGDHHHGGSGLAVSSDRIRPRSPSAIDGPISSVIRPPPLFPATAPSGLGITSPTSPQLRPSTSTSNSTHSHFLPPHPQDDFDDEYTDDRAHTVIHGRLIQGHIVDDDYPSPAPSTTYNQEDHMISSIHSLNSLHPAENALGGTIDAHNTDDEDEADIAPGSESLITLVGEVRGRTVLLVDDMIDRAGSWISAAEHVKKRGGAGKVICLATHGVFGGECLKEMEQCSFIDQIVITNSFPIDPEKAKGVKKLTIIDLSLLLSEAIRRNHHGESISALFQHFTD